MSQPTPYFYNALVPSSGSYMPKKLSGRFWEINILSEKLTMTDDDGQLGIRKVPLPFGWRS